MVRLYTGKTTRERDYKSWPSLVKRNFSCEFFSGWHGPGRVFYEPEVVSMQGLSDPQQIAVPIL
jgi:hypothetical protein